MRDALRLALQKAVSVSGSPGAAACVADRDRTYFLAAEGLRAREPQPLPAKQDTPYDLASLTKVVATTTAIMLLRDEGALDLDQPVSEILPIPAFSGFTLRHVMTHTAGLVAGLPLYKTATSLDEMLQIYAQIGPDWPAGTRYRYSDVDFMILGRVVELTAREPLDRFCAKRIFTPLGMTRTAFNPPAAWASSCAATELCGWRSKLLCGQVHDENAYAVGGVSGHAGLFSTAGDLEKFCRALLTGRILAEKTLEEMTRLGQTACFPWQGLGWKIDPWECGKEGYLPARNAFGHTGWTGTNIWMDRESGLFTLLLSNTCHPSRGNRNNESLRRTFSSAAAREFFPRQANTHSGLDRVVWDEYDAVAGKRLALLTHHAAVDLLGRPVWDVLGHDARVRVVRLYTPEHGLLGAAEAGEAVPSQTGPIPITSLYGAQKQPSLEELREIDLFVVDLQDVGARFYTYPATMLSCLRACAAAKTPVLVFDRPNPTGGKILEGPIATRTGSPVCWGAVPARHGMTMGEIALFFGATELKGSSLKLSVIKLDNWARARLFGECALPWIPPSPNIPTPETAVLYTGMCLFEGVNVNEGRGTNAPFSVIGAPWLDAEAVLRAMPPGSFPGCTLHRFAYTPESLPGRAANPRYKGQSCQGIQIEINDVHDVRAFTGAVALLCAIQQRHPDQLIWDPHFDSLAGSTQLREDIQNGKRAEAIMHGYRPGLEAFAVRVPRLYS